MRRVWRARRWGLPAPGAGRRALGAGLSLRRTPGLWAHPSGQKRPRGSRGRPRPHAHGPESPRPLRHPRGDVGPRGSGRPPHASHRVAERAGGPPWRTGAWTWGSSPGRGTSRRRHRHGSRPDSARRLRPGRLGPRLPSGSGCRDAAGGSRPHPQAPLRPCRRTAPEPGCPVRVGPVDGHRSPPASWMSSRAARSARPRWGRRRGRTRVGSGRRRLGGAGPAHVQHQRGAQLPLPTRPFVALWHRRPGPTAPAGLAPATMCSGATDRDEPAAAAATTSRAVRLGSRPTAALRIEPDHLTLGTGPPPAPRHGQFPAVQLDDAGGGR